MAEDNGSVFSKNIQMFGSLLTTLVAVAGFLWGVYQFNIQQQSNSKMAVQQNLATQEQALDQQRENTLDTYLDRMSTLLLDYQLASKPTGEVRALAQTRTYTALLNLDGNRKGTLLQFLWGAYLIWGQKPIIYLTNADLSNANLSKAVLGNANLSAANLRYATLNFAELQNTDLSNADLGNANLSGGFMVGTNFHLANLSNANLTNALFLTQQQLDQVSTCKGALLPMGLICNKNK